MLEHNFFYSSCTIPYEKVILSNRSSQSDVVTKKKTNELSFGMFY